MGFISNKKVKGVISSSLVLSAVVPKVVGAQKDVINKVRSGINYAKLSVVYFFIEQFGKTKAASYWAGL